jgi:hypothetical protein
MTVLPLVGAKALRAFQAFNALLLGLKMLPVYQNWAYEKFFEDFQDKTESEKETCIREALAFVELKPDEIEAVLSFATDKNGVPFSSVNTKSMPLAELFETMVLVLAEIGKIKIYLVTPEEKKNCQSSQ